VARAAQRGSMAGGPPPPIHPVLEQSVSFLLGTWRVEGEGGYPTIQSFKYGEEIKLWHVGKVILLTESLFEDTAKVLIA
jgi:hypothetical protein